MKVAIDRAGRIVLPRRIRRLAGLEEARQVEVTAVEGHVQIEPVRPIARVVEEDGVLVAVAEEPVPPLTPEQEREALERDRSHREARW